ncbi:MULTISPECIES: hypothetical protein [unclassified Isoptericola]|uniref:hypothetical protein n=1 Tax=unclassified Isoptericola TaxID=2623355 RepID=UPI00365BFC8D
MATPQHSGGVATPPRPLRINAHAPLWRIVDALAASGWGDLRDAPQSVRTYLLALGRIADARSGIAETTDAQVAERAGLSVRTIMRARSWLEERELLVVMRRGARQGLRGVASLLSVTKRALVAMLPAARAGKDARTRARGARPGGAPNLTRWRAFPSSRRKTGAAPRQPRPDGPTNIQKQLVEEAAHAAANPVRPETLASIRALIARR